MKNKKLISYVTALVCGLTCLVPVHTMAYETGDSEVYEESASTETTVVQTGTVTTAPEQTAVTTTTTITRYEVETIPVTTAYIAGVDINNVRPANAENVVIEPGSTAEMKLSISDNMDIFDNCSGRMTLPEGINCEKISYGDGGIAEFKVSGSAVTFEMPESTVTITLSADVEISDGEYQISFDYITRTYSRPSGDIYIAGGYRYKASGGAVTVESPAVTTTVPVTTTTTTTTTTTSIIPVTSIVVTETPPGPCPWIPGEEIARKVYVDNVVVNIGETAEMKFSVPDRGTIDGDYSITAYLPAGVYCENIIDCETELNIKFSMKTDEENNSVSFSIPSDEIIMTISAEDGSVPGTYSTRFSSSAGYSKPYGDYYHIFGSISLNFSGGTIEITDPESPAVTTTVIPVTKPENTETQPVTTTVIPVTTVPETQETQPVTQVKGDISGNGEIDIYDAVEIAKEILGMRTFTDEEKEIADINGDGAVNLYDAIYIAKIFI